MNIRMVGAILLLCMSVLTLGCQQKPQPPQVSAWKANETILTVKEVEEVPGLGIGWVIIRRSSDPHIYFAAAVVPYRAIPVGASVRVHKMVWEINRVQIPNIPSELLVVRPN